MDNKSIVRLALDIRHGTVPSEYANQDASDVLRQALIAANGGSSTFDYKNLRRNKVEIFEIIEEILPVLIQEGLQGDEFWNRFVDSRRLNLGDKNEFVVEDDSLFVVSEMASGILTPRRQRIGGRTSVKIDTRVHGIRIYEELSRYMAGRIDWNDLIDRVSRSYVAELRNEIYNKFSAITAATPGMDSNYVKSGSFNEETLLRLVEDVEAANNAPATIIGTKPALRKCVSAVMSDSAKEDYYNMGYYGRIAGVPMVSIQNRHQVGSNTMIIPDNKLWVVSGDEKFILHVDEGEDIVVEKNIGDNADASLEYTMISKWGTGLLIRSKLGIMNLS